MDRSSPDRFIVDQADPAYLAPGVHDGLADRVRDAVAELACCRACPRDCRVNRLNDETLLCSTGRHARVSSAFAHLGEEDVLRGWRGSGTIFFSMCNLRCVFCQNWDISQRLGGESVTATELADTMLALQERGCHNINLVTPEHVVPQIVEALAVAIDRGLSLPVVYNTSAYDGINSLKLMEGLVDIYMPDFKFWRTETARRLAKAKDYPDRAREAIREMHRQVGDLRLLPNGLACRGVLVRHLVMPGQVHESREIFFWLANELSRDTFVNIMGQYRPAYEVGTSMRKGGRSSKPRHVDINRAPTDHELAEAYEAARDAGLWRFDGPKA